MKINPYHMRSNHIIDKSMLEKSLSSLLKKYEDRNFEKYF